ncbi:hypothetical protein QR680_000920 [Steinernema hermaphroditum]|uniref:Proteasomal ATPase-associated factor 1 n=1 Tax=Steinernema hermaphroditum TaxID=289476 RepID=A0AA39LF49_9BILA|nr:hypothetical protein QR680_000920 [Steinernema hermaphroditum]
MSVYELKDQGSCTVGETAFTIQHDWFELFRSDRKRDEEDLEQGQKFYVGKRHAKNAVDYYNVFPNPHIAHLNIDDKLEIVDYSEEERRITIKDRLSDVQTAFYAPRLTYFGPHKSPILSLDGTNKADYLASSDENGKLLLWNSDDACVLRDIQGHIMDVNVCRFFPNGGILLTGGMDMTVRVWSVLESPANNVRTFKGHSKAITDLAIIDVGKEVLSASKDGSVRQWRCSDEVCVQNCQMDSGEVRAICIIPSMGAFAAACEKNAVVIWSYKDDSRGMLLRFCLNESCHPNSISVVNDKFLVVGSDEGTLSIIDIDERKLHKVIATGRGEVIRIKTIVEKEAVAVSFVDGSMVLYSYANATYNPIVELCNGELDPVRDFTFVKAKLYTASRDGVVRMFAF